MSIVMAVTNTNRPDVKALVKALNSTNRVYVVAYQDGDKHWVDSTTSHLEALHKAQKHCEDVHHGS